MGRFAERRGTPEGGLANYAHLDPRYGWTIWHQMQTYEFDAQKFEDRWYGGEDPDEDFDNLGAMLNEKRYKGEYFKEHNLTIKKTNPDFHDDNVYWMKYASRTSQITLPRVRGTPHFSDLHMHAPFAVTYNCARYSLFLYFQWAHCVGQMGADHTTCKKARWWYDKACNPVHYNFFTEMEELGHVDETLLYGIKNRQSFRPMYQPVKTNIPGHFEFCMSNWQRDNWESDGTGTTMYPVPFVT